MRNITLHEKKKIPTTQSYISPEYNETQKKSQENRNDYIGITLNEDIDPEDINDDAATELADVDLISNTRIKVKSKIITE
ncbi:hypothetical protein K6025_05140 [Ehrlichia sp. JZT12]